MPTTDSGTAYVTETIDLGDPYGVMHLTRRADLSQPPRTVEYFHGSQGPSDQFVTNAAWKPTLNRLMDEGDTPYLVVEGSGGVGTGPGNWGNMLSQESYLRYSDEANSRYGTEGTVALPRSMGGLAGLNLYAKDTEDRFLGLIGNSCVSTALVGALSGSKDINAATGWFFSPAIFTAWGVSDVAGLQTAMRDANSVPEEFDPSAWQGKKVLQLYGTADPTVPWYPRGGAALREAWSGRLALDQVYAREGGVHAGSNTSYYDVEPMISFLDEVFTGEPPEPPQEIVSLVTGAYIESGGLRYEVTF